MTTEDQTLNERVGYVKVMCVEGCYALHRSEYDRLTTALREQRAGMRDDPFFEGTDNYGSTLFVELAAVEAVTDWPAEAVRRCIEEEEMVEARKRWESD